MYNFLKLAALGLVLAVIGASPVSAGRQDYSVNNNFPFIVYFQITSRDGSTVWPNGGTYILNRTYHTFAINCVPGQRICWGASNMSTGGPGTTYWGQGVVPNRQDCSDCCHVCSPGTIIRLNLNP